MKKLQYRETTKLTAIGSSCFQGSIYQSSVVAWTVSLQWPTNSVQLSLSSSDNFFCSELSCYSQYRNGRR